MVLQRARVISILKCVVAIGEGSSRLGILSGDPSLSLFDMLLVTKGGLGTSCSPCGSPS
jgi:hypothetical protein